MSISARLGELAFLAAACVGCVSDADVDLDHPCDPNGRVIDTRTGLPVGCEWDLGAAAHDVGRSTVDRGGEGSVPGSGGVGDAADLGGRSGPGGLDGALDLGGAPGLGGDPNTGGEPGQGGAGGGGGEPCDPNACGTCGPTPAEVCNGLDDDCDGKADEELRNACGGCGPVPGEVCNGLDDDCDGATDEGLLNACGTCGPPPVDVCNGRDDDCDGSTDEGLRNACGACGPTPAELCNDLDDDCDGRTDEGHDGAPLLITLDRGIDWVCIRGGTFMMGSPDGEGEPIERPRRRVTVPTFEMARTEVTVAQYRACDGCEAPLSEGSCNWDAPGRDDHPVNCVRWSAASTFAASVGGRLPSEAEWEFAARSRGMDQRYPWGDADPTDDLAVFAPSAQGTSAVCRKPMGNTAQGLCDMAGNVWEWVEDWYGPYGEAPTDGSARFVQGADPYRVNRGGGWTGPAVKLRAVDRRGGTLDNRNDNLGFRVARSVP